MNRAMILLAVVLLTASCATGATTWRFGTGGVGHGGQTGTRFSYTHTGSHHSLSITTGSSFVTRSSSYSGWYGPSGYGAYPISGWTTITDPRTGQGYSFVNPWSYQSYTAPRYGYTFMGPTDAGTVISTGSRRGFTNEFSDPRFAAAGPPAAAGPAAPAAGIALPRGIAPPPGPLALDQGDELFAAGRYAQATRVFQNGVDADPDNGLAYLALGHSLFATGEYTKAAAALGKGVELLPHWGEVQMDRRSFYTDPSDFQVQMWALSQHLIQHPEDVDARIVLGYNYYFTGRHGPARVEFEKALQFDPQNRISGYFLRYLQP